MNSLRNNQEVLVAKAHYDKIRNRNYSKIHIPLCSLNDSSKTKLEIHDSNMNCSNFLENNINEFEDSKWKSKREEDDTNSCIRNIPCSLIDFQLRKIKQLAESGRPWLETNWNREIKNSEFAKEEYHDFHTYITNQKLSLLSPDHRIQLYKVGTFSNEPQYTNELQNDIYNEQEYIQKFKTFEHFSNDMPQFYGRSQRICKPSEFSSPPSFANEIVIKYEASIDSTSLEDLQKKIELEEELSCDEEFENKNDKIFKSKNNFEIFDLDITCVSSNVKGINEELLQSQNSINDNQNLERINKEFSQSQNPINDNQNLKIVGKKEEQR